MTKFRKWLIHKLGGVLEEEKPVVLKIESFTLETITVKANEKDYIQYGENFEEYIKNDLKLGILEHIHPCYIHKYDSETHTYFFEAKIKLPSVYINREANND